MVNTNPITTVTYKTINGLSYASSVTTTSSSGKSSTKKIDTSKIESEQASSQESHYQDIAKARGISIEEAKKQVLAEQTKSKTVTVNTQSSSSPEQKTNNFIKTPNLRLPPPTNDPNFLLRNREQQQTSQQNKFEQVQQQQQNIKEITKDDNVFYPQTRYNSKGEPYTAIPTSTTESFTETNPLTGEVITKKVTTSSIKDINFYDQMMINKTLEVESKGVNQTVKKAYQEIDLSKTKFNTIVPKTDIKSKEQLLKSQKGVNLENVDTTMKSLGKTSFEFLQSRQTSLDPSSDIVKFANPETYKFQQSYLKSQDETTDFFGRTAVKTTATILGTAGGITLLAPVVTAISSSAVGSAVLKTGAVLYGASVVKRTSALVTGKDITIKGQVIEPYKDKPIKRFLSGVQLGSELAGVGLGVASVKAKQIDTSTYKTRYSTTKETSSKDFIIRDVGDVVTKGGKPLSVRTKIIFQENGKSIFETKIYSPKGKVVFSDTGTATLYSQQLPKGTIKTKILLTSAKSGTSSFYSGKTQIKPITSDSGKTYYEVITKSGVRTYKTKLPEKYVVTRRYEGETYDLAKNAFTTKTQQEIQSDIKLIRTQQAVKTKIEPRLISSEQTQFSITTKPVKYKTKIPFFERIEVKTKTIGSGISSFADVSIRPKPMFTQGLIPTSTPKPSIFSIGSLGQTAIGLKPNISNVFLPINFRTNYQKSFASGRDIALRNTPSTISSSILRQKPISETTSITKTSTDLSSISESKSSQALASSLTSATETPTPQIPIILQSPSQIKTTTIIKLPEMQSKLTKEKGLFDVYVRKKGKFVKAGEGFDLQTAIRKGKEIVGTTASASFKVVERKSQRVVNLQGMGLSNDRFYASRKESGVIIEKSSKRIKSLGELREITFKGIQSQRRRRF